MKKYITYAVLLLCAALTASCSKEGTAGSADGTGVLEMKISTTRADAAAEYDPMDHLAVRIYQTRAEGEVLLRQYTAATRPERLELLAGNYRVAVEAGEIVPASFTKRFYKGEKTFTVTAGETTPVEIECKRQNVVAEVKFDATVRAAFGEDFHAWVAAADTFDQTQAELVPSLQYTADGTGYFTMPEGVTTLSTSFWGKHPERGEITHETKFENVLAGGKYTVTFRFSKDLPGFIECFILKVDTSTEDEDDTIPFSPEPTIEGDGFMLSQPQSFVPGTTLSKSYMISAMAAIKDVKITIGATTYDALNETTPGIEIVKDGDLSLTLTLSEALFAGLSGGSFPVSIHVADITDAQTTGISEYRIQGLLPVKTSDYDLWTNSITLRAMVVDPQATAPTFGLRVAEGTWIDIPGVNAGDGLYTATFDAEWDESQNAAGLKVYTPKPGTGVFAGTSYEARAVLDGSATYDTAFVTPAGQIIPGGDMEDASLPCFGSKTSETTAFWGSGNAATAGLCSQGTKPGMGGEHCAVLQSQSAFGMLAAGNLFSATFKFASLLGTVSFGVPYEWQARPTAMRLKYHATVGAVNKGTISKEHEYIQDGQDRSRIYVAIVDWKTRHETSTGMGDPTGTWDPAKANETDEGKIIACGSILIKDSTEGDDMVTIDIPIDYYDKVTKPSKTYSLIISCSTSTYGDYKVGCLGNVMYVDDFEWVY